MGEKDMAGNLTGRKTASSKQQAEFHQGTKKSSHGQRRNVTVLFADLSNSTQLSEKVDSEDLYEIIQRFLKLLANSVHKFEGTVDKFTGDGLMALFGAPMAYENNAERAVLAAMDMQAGLSELNKDLTPQYGFNLKMHVGLNSGTVILGNVGSDQTMEFTAIGEMVNLAQRLESAAGPGEILVSENVYRQTRSLFTYEQQQELKIKGIGHSINGYKLIGKRSETRSLRGFDDLRAIMVGRDAELQKILGAVHSLVERNSGSFVLIRGEAGIGKTRLVNELIARVKDKFINITQGLNVSYRRSSPYWVFQECLRQYLGVTSDTTEPQIREKLSKQVMGVLGPQAQDVLPYLEHLMSLTPADPSLPERLSYFTADQLRQQIFIAFRNWLVAEAQYCPIILVLEDLHWADDASLELLLFLMDAVRTNPILICGITRIWDSELLTQINNRAQNMLGSQYQGIELKSLPPAQNKQLFHQLLTFPDLPPTFQNEILSRSDGVPFYLEEILRMLIDDGVITQVQGSWQLNPEAENTIHGVPDNIQALILARFDHLDPLGKQVLQAASAIGQTFSLPVLSDVLEESPDNLQENLDELVDKAFLEKRDGEPASEYSFRHVLTSEAIYSTLLRRDTRDLHERIGLAIEKRYRERINEHIYSLARHYSLSSKDDKALHYLFLAGEAAARNHLSAQARNYYEQALDINNRTPGAPKQVGRIYTGLGDVLVWIGEYENARRYYDDALNLIEPEDNSQTRQFIALHRKISTTFERQGDFDQAVSQLDAAQQLISQLTDPLPFEAAKNFSNIGWINFRRGDLDAAEENLTKALSLVENSTQYDVIASIYNRLGGVFYQKDDLNQSGYYVRKSLVLREEIGDYGAIARCYNNLGLLAWKLGDWDEALDDFTRSIDLTKNLNDIEATIFLHNNIGLLQTDKGNLETAREHLSESLTISQQVGHVALEGETYLHYSRYWLAAHGWEKSLFYCQRALEIFEEIGSPDRLVDLNVSMGEAWFGLGEIDKANQAGQKALGIVDVHSGTRLPSEGYARVLRLIGNIQRVQGEYDHARRNLLTSRDQFIEIKNQLELGRTYHGLALLEKDLENFAKARIHAREAGHLFRKLGAKLDENRVDSLRDALR
jgi:predicted ATPase/class 3 adenylate cyclase